MYSIAWIRSERKDHGALIVITCPRKRDIGLYQGVAERIYRPGLAIQVDPRHCACLVDPVVVTVRPVGTITWTRCGGDTLQTFEGHRLQCVGESTRLHISQEILFAWRKRL